MQPFEIHKFQYASNGVYLNVDGQQLTPEGP